MNINSIQRSLPIVATTLCDRFGVQIILSGDEAKTDGQTIMLPSLLESKLDPTVLYGFLLHESGHVRLSTFGLRSKHRNLQGLHHALLNVLEDGRIEREMCNLYAGGFHWIKTMDAYTLRDANAIGNPQTFQKPNKKPLETFINFLFFWTRINFVGLGSLYADGYAVSNADFLRCFGADVQTQLLNLLKKSLACASTAALSKVADEILDLLLSLQQQAEEHQKGGQPQKPQEKQPRADTSAGKPEAMPFPANSSPDSQNDSVAKENDGKAFQLSSESGTQPQVAASDVLGSAQTDIQNACQGTDAAQTVADTLKAEAKETRSNRTEWIGYVDPSSVIGGLKKPVVMDDTTVDPLQVESVLRSSRSIALRLERSLRTKIEARNRTGVFHTHSGNQLNSRRLASFVTGNTKVFDRKIDKREVNTAIEIMLDMSGSMRRDGIHLAAKKAAIAFGMATHRIQGVDVGICTFSDVLASGRPNVQSHLEHRGSQSNKVWEALASYPPRGGTPCQQALIASVFRLSKCKKSTRHILFFITDGDVNDAIPLIKRLKAANIESRALFISSDALPQVFDYETRISASANSDVITRSIIDLMSESVLS